MAEAAEKRLKESDGRGLKDPEGFKRKQLAQQKAAEEDMRQGGGEANLKVHFMVCMKITTACSLLYVIRVHNPFTYLLTLPLQWNMS